jgi:hypothetical protein
MHTSSGIRQRERLTVGDQDREIQQERDALPIKDSMRWSVEREVLQ